MGKQPYTAARKAGNKKWDAENYKCFTVQADRHLVDCFTALDAELGRSRNDYIKEAMTTFIETYTDKLIESQKDE